MLSLSQSHLTFLDACERKYQYVFWDALSGPASCEQQMTAQWGSQFHRLMQQRALNLPVEVMVGADVEMADSLAALAEAAPEVFAYLPEATQDAETFSQSEHRRTLVFNGYLLTVIYDLVVQTPQFGQIFDWKTHQSPPRKEWLSGDWQTRLYLYVLCETTDLRPEQLSMTYWFVRPGVGDRALEAASLAQLPVGRRPASYRFDYSESQHRQTQADLQRLSDRLTKLRELAERAVDFPKVPIEKGLCDRCPFNVRCDRAIFPPSAIALSPDPYQILQAASQVTVETVEEIPLP